MIVLSPLLSTVYALPRSLLVAMGVANLAYGTYSAVLASRARRPYRHVVLLVAANAAWAVLCALAAIRFWGTASAFGLAHLAGEGLLVGGLAAVEWRVRARLLGAG